MLLERSESWRILGLSAVHPVFLTPQIVEKRRPLAPTARRAGWVGCNIRLDLMGPDALLEIIKAGVPADRASVRQGFRNLARLREVPVDRRGWTTLTLAVIRGLGPPQFSLRDLYAKECVFGASYPRNRNIRAKIRQQLQVLRDLGYLEFSGSGEYRLIL
jgi:type II restriction enzyme